MYTLSRTTIPKYVLNFFLWGPSAFPVAGSTCTTGHSTPGGLVDNDCRREALRVRFTADVEADASEVGGGGGGEGGEGGGGGGGGGGGVVVGAGGEPMIFYTITYKIGLMKRGLVISFFWKAKKRKRGTSNNLKVVHSGTKEFKIASNKRDLFLGFSEHEERLRKKLALEEGRIFVANEQLS
ncbi:hypothetical protein GmHk_12G034614 [Glycine max]|nr:hypothetical protein GmHk_12G034614 [Glycine max]